MNRETFRFSMNWHTGFERGRRSHIFGCASESPLAVNGEEMDLVCGGPSISLNIIGFGRMNR